MVGDGRDERVERTRLLGQDGLDGDACLGQPRLGVRERDGVFAARRPEQRHADVAVADEFDDELDDSVRRDVPGQRDEQASDRARDAGDGERPRADLVCDPVDGLLLVAGEDESVVCRAAGVPELLGDVRQCRVRACFVLEAGLVGRRLLGEDVVAQHRHVHRLQEGHQPRRDRTALQHRDGDDDASHHRAPLSDTSRA